MYSAKKISVDESREARVDSPFWDEVGKSPRFVNIVNGEVSLYDTRAAVVWSEEHLLVKYWAQEPFLNGTMMTRDQLLFNENNVELFIDGGDSYYELELSANNIVYEVLFVWRDAFDSDNPRYAGLEPLKNGLTFGGNNDRNSETFWTGDHPRGVRWAFPEWDLAGLRVPGGSRRKICGQLRSRDVSRVDMVIRWGGMRRLSGFLPVQSVYADFFVVDRLWPDFQPEDFEQALRWYQKQDVTRGG